MTDEEKAREIAYGIASRYAMGYVVQECADLMAEALAFAIREARVEGARKMRNAVRVKLWEATIRDSDTAIDVVDALDPAEVVR